MLRPARTDRFRLRRGPFIPGGSQLDWAGSFAFLAPMPLRTVQALPHSAVIAHENFFSHGSLVSTSWDPLCQVLFFELPDKGARRASHPRLSQVLKEIQSGRKKRLACQWPNPTMALKPRDS
jgi:hypothetical protein